MEAVKVYVGVIMLADIVLVFSQENKYLETTYIPKIPKVDAHKSLICLLYPLYVKVQKSDQTGD